VDESRNPNYALLQSCQSHGVSRMSKSSISCFFVFSLVCCFARYCGVALVRWCYWWSVILASQWILFMSCVNDGSGRGLVWNFLGSKRMWRRESYMKLVEVKERFFYFASGEKLSSCLLLTKMCGICLEFYSNQLRTKAPLDFFFSWT